MKYVVKPFPVLYACAGCREFGYSAPRVAHRLDEQGLAHAIWLGAAPPPCLSTRYPIYTLDACPARCAEAWVKKQGGDVARALVLEALERFDPERAASRIAATL